MGDDWEGKFDDLKEQDIEVIYLSRTVKGYEEISTSKIKNELKESNI
jgi:hypothetical protein